MNFAIKQTFTSVKPFCDALMMNPTQETISQFNSVIKNVPTECIQEMQLYILYPIISHIKLKEFRTKQELLRLLIDSMELVIGKITINSSEAFIKYHSCLLNLAFDMKQPGMVAQISEELKLSITQCLTTLMLNTDDETKVKIFKDSIPLIAQAIFIVVNIAKQEKLRALKISAIKCVMAYTAIHDNFVSDDYKIKNADLETAAVEMGANVLPGMLGALQDVATSTENPGHAVIVLALSSIHRIVCLIMNNKYLPHNDDVTTDDFIKLFQDKAKMTTDNEVRNLEKLPKDMVKRSPEWFTMAGEKLKIVTQSLGSLQTHEHVKVRKELAVFSYRLLTECSKTMYPSIPLVLNTLIALSKDDYPEVSEYCSQRLQTYFQNMSNKAKYNTLDSLADNFLDALNNLPKILNNIDNGRKLSALNLLHGYISILSARAATPSAMAPMATPPAMAPLVTPPAMAALATPPAMAALARALLEAARADTHISLLALTGVRHLEMPPVNSPWCKLKHLDDEQCERRFVEICRMLGEAECADLLVDQLLDMFHESFSDRKEIVYVLNHVASAPSSAKPLVERVINTYIEEDAWYLPLEVGQVESPVTSEETLDVTVYNPRAWDEDSVPGLFEGAVATRYTDISYQSPGAGRGRARGRGRASLGAAQHNMAASCAQAAGLGAMAARLGDGFQPYLLRTLCLVLERVGSNYELLHLAGLRAIHDIARACGHRHVAELIQHNADYITYQVTTRLKKAWNSQSALQILTVVMEYSDVSILNCLYGIVSDVLVQSCDKYHENDLSAYLQVFLTFVTCIQRWFPDAILDENMASREEGVSADLNVMRDVLEFIDNVVDSEKLLDTNEFEKETGESADEMYRADVKKREDELLDYDDRVTEEKLPPPQQIQITITILKRCIHFVSSKRRDEKLLAMRVIEEGLKILRRCEDELLPLVHQSWSPLAGRFAEAHEPAVPRHALRLLVTMAAVSKDFIRVRTIKDVLPNVYKFLRNSSRESYLKDIGSAYRHSQAYKLQVAALSALPTLVRDLNLEDEHLEVLMDSVESYLSNKQPKPLQELAVGLFTTILNHDYGALWHHFRKFCKNENSIEPSEELSQYLDTIVGTPYNSSDVTFSANILKVFNS